MGEPHFGTSVGAPLLDPLWVSLLWDITWKTAGHTPDDHPGVRPLGDARWAMPRWTPGVNHPVGPLLGEPRWGTVLGILP